jgi:hypothetical protein
VLVHNKLILDHFYFSATDEQFEDLKNLFSHVQCANHQKVQSDGDSWEGIYINTRSQFYLEILKARRPNCIGVCQKPINPLYTDARDIVRDLPDLPWQTFERSIDGQKWFTALSLDNYFDLTTPLNAWVTHYHQMVRSYTPRFPKYEIQTIFEMNIQGDPNLKDPVRRNSSWLHGQNEYLENQYIFNLKTYYSDPMKMNIQFQKGSIGLQMKSLSFRFIEGFDPSALLATKMNHFTFTAFEDHFELRPKAK